MSCDLVKILVLASAVLLIAGSASVTSNIQTAAAQGKNSTNQSARADPDLGELEESESDIPEAVEPDTEDRSICADYDYGNAIPESMANECLQETPKVETTQADLNGEFECNDVVHLYPEPGSVCVSTDLSWYRIDQPITINGSVIEPYSVGDNVTLEIRMPNGTIYHSWTEEIKQEGVFGPTSTSVGGPAVEGNQSQYYGSYSVSATYKGNQYEWRFDIVSDEQGRIKEERELIDRIFFSIEGVNGVGFGRGQMGEKIIVVMVEDESVCIPEKVLGYTVEKMVVKFFK